jgi:hypothetical protein
MNLTDADVATNRFTDEISLHTWASYFLETSSGSSVEYSKERIECLCSRLSSEGKGRFLEEILDRMFCFAINTAGSAVVAERVDWLICNITGRAAQHVLDRFFVGLRRTGSRYPNGLTAMIRILVPGLAYRSLVGWTLDVPKGESPTLPDLALSAQLKRSGSLDTLASFVEPWRSVWEAAVAQGHTAYLVQVTPILLDTTPLPDVLVHLVNAYV